MLSRAPAKPWPLSLGVVVLLAALAGLQLEYPRAITGIVWRVAFLSWDNPATQAAQDQTCETAPQTGVALEVHQRICAAAASQRRLPLSDRGARARAAVRSVFAPRSPPLPS